MKLTSDKLKYTKSYILYILEDIYYDTPLYGYGYYERFDSCLFVMEYYNCILKSSSAKKEYNKIRHIHLMDKK